jgi:L-ribulokinase
MPDSSFVIGIDFGTDSVRSLILDASNGEEVASSVFYYPRWKAGLYCDPSNNQFRQHPLDYIEGLEHTIKHCLVQAGPAVVPRIKAISVDTTGSTLVATDETGTPLSMLPGFEENPNAMFVLWKDHTAVKEAGEINAHAEGFDENYLKYVGGIYSSEWFWAKLLFILREDESIRNSYSSWVEHCDWIPFLLTGGKHVAEMKRGVCSAGHKALWAADFDGLPPEKFFFSLDPLLKGVRSKLYKETYTADQAAGRISKEWAERLGLPEDILIGIGAFDAHMGAVGGQIEPYYLSKVMGTSTCDILVVPLLDVQDKLVKGICGQVNGSVIPGMMGMEAGQSAFGDAYAWFRSILSWPLQNILSKSSIIDGDTAKALGEEVIEKIIPELSREASLLRVDEKSESAIDWFNGRRTPDANQLLKGSISDLNLGSDAPKVFRAIVEATCFGAKAIVDRFIDEGIPVRGLIGIGGVAKKSPFIMQMMADVMNMPIRINKSEQTCAVGAAMFAATVAGIYDKVENAITAMGQGFDAEYLPDKKRNAVYEKRYEKYRSTGLLMEQIINEKRHTGITRQEHLRVED